MKNLLVLLVAIVCGTASILGQDVLYLKNGSIIKGELLKVIPNDKIQIQLPSGTILSYYTGEATMITQDESSKAPNQYDVLYLNNGSIIRGYLSEYIFGKTVSLKSIDGSLFVYNADEISQITKENYNVISSTRSERENRRKAQSGYRAFIAFTPGYYISGIDAYEISTTHGFQINHNFFVGGGVGLDIIGLAHRVDMVAITIYTAFNGNAGSHVAQFTYGSRIGLSIIDSYVPFMWNVNVGLRLGFTPTFGLSITPDFSLLASSDFFDARIGLRIGIDF